MDNNELMPCPFCGGKAYINEFMSQPCQLHGDREKMYRVQCKHQDAKWKDNSVLPYCHAKPVITGGSKEQVRERWNTRPTVTPTDGEVERALELFDKLLERFFIYYYESDWLDEVLEIRAALQSTRKQTGGE
jgi:hypothetical protein